MERPMHLSEVARLCGVQPYRIVYAHATGALPEPNRFCGRRAYSREDVEKVAVFFGIKLPKEGEECSGINS